MLHRHFGSRAGLLASALVQTCCFTHFFYVLLALGLALDALGGSIGPVLCLSVCVRGGIAKSLLFGAWTFVLSHGFALCALFAHARVRGGFAIQWCSVRGHLRRLLFFCLPCCLAELVLALRVHADLCNFIVALFIVGLSLRALFFSAPLCSMSRQF